MNASIVAVAACAMLALALTSTEPGSASNAAAGDVSPSAKAAVQDAIPVDRVVCRSETVTGSRFTRRICHKASEWAARAEAARQGFADVQNRPMVKIIPPNGNGGQ